MNKVVSNINYVFGSRVTVILARLFTIYILSNSLGISNYGIYSFLISILLITALIGNLGVGYSNIYHLAKEEIELSKIIGSSILISGVLGLFIGIIIQFIPSLFNTMFQDVSNILMIIVGFTIPILILHRFLTDIVNGLENFRLYYLSFSFGWVINSILIGILYTFQKLTITTAVISLSLSKLFILIFVLVHLLNKNKWKIRISISDLLSQIRYGIPLYIRDFFNQINFRFVYLLIKHYYSSSALGAFALAVQSAEVLLYIPRSGFTLLFPKFSGYKGDKRELFSNIIPKFLIVFLVVVIISYFVYPIVISKFFDNSYLGAVPLFRILLFGVLCLGILNIVESYILVNQLQRLTMISSVISAVLLVILSFVFIPIYGDFSAAIISSSVYLFYLLLILIMLKNVEYNK